MEAAAIAAGLAPIADASEAWRPSDEVRGSVMALDFAKFGLNEADVLRDTHAQTAMRVASIVGDTLAVAIKAKLTADGKPVNERMFKHKGQYETLENRINGAHELGLIDEVTRDDAHLMRRARNKFGHAKDRVHFDSNKIVALLKQMSTYEAAEHNQDAFLHAAGNVSEQALRKQ